MASSKHCRTSDEKSQQLQAQHHEFTTIEDLHIFILGYSHLNNDETKTDETEPDTESFSNADTIIPKETDSIIPLHPQTTPPVDESQQPALTCIPLEPHENAPK